MNKKVGAGVLFLAIGAILGALAGFGVERSSLIYFFSGRPSLMADPKEPHKRYPNPLDGLFPLALGAIGAIGGAVVGKIYEASQKNNEKTPSA